jgi:hypothetical protein
MLSIFFIFLILATKLHDGAKVQFDNQYDVYAKNDEGLSFGYNANQVCLIRKLGDDYYVGIEDAYSIFKTPIMRLRYLESNSTVKTCFNYNGYSYIISEYKNITVIMRGRSMQTFKFPLFDKYLFDHLAMKLYCYNSRIGELWEVSLPDIEAFWTIDNYAQKLVKSRHSISLRDFFALRKRIVSVLDIMVFNNTVYFTRQYQNNSIIAYKSHLKSHTEQSIGPTDYPKFQFIPYLQISKYYQNYTNSKIKWALNPSLPTIVLSLPSSTIITEQTPVSMLVGLYFLDALFVILTVWGLKYLYKFTRQRFKENKKDNEISYQEIIDKDISQVSLPYKQIVVTSHSA